MHKSILFLLDMVLFAFLFSVVTASTCPPDVSTAAFPAAITPKQAEEAGESFIRDYAVVGHKSLLVPDYMIENKHTYISSGSFFLIYELSASIGVHKRQNMLIVEMDRNGGIRNVFSLKNNHYVFMSL
jgi:hypothetical protein